MLCMQVGSSELSGGGWREVAIPVTSLGEGHTYTIRHREEFIIVFLF